MYTLVPLYWKAGQKSKKQISTWPDLAEALGIPPGEFTATAGWIQLFKKRKGIGHSGAPDSSLSLPAEPIEARDDTTAARVADYIKTKVHTFTRLLATCLSSPLRVPRIVK